MEARIKNALRRLIPEPNNLSSRAFSKLHQSILGISNDPTKALLRASRPSINDADTSGRSVLHWAAYQGDEDMLNAILRCGADPDLQCISGRTPLHYATRVGATICVTALIDAGAQLNVPDKQGETPLHSAADHKQNGILRLLLEAGAEPNQKNYLGEAPIAYAATENNAEGVSILLDHGSEISLSDHRGFTPLLDSLWANAHDVVIILIESGADIAAATVDGMTALHFIAQQGDIRLMEILLNMPLFRINTTSLNKDGLTAYELLRQRSDLTDTMIETFGAIILNCNAGLCDTVSRQTIVIHYDDVGEENSFLDAAEDLSETDEFFNVAESIDL